jgi:hypothetical protein
MLYKKLRNEESLMKKIFIITPTGRWHTAGRSRPFPEQQESNRVHGPGGGLDRAGTGKSNTLPPPLRTWGAA